MKSDRYRQLDTAGEDLLRHWQDLNDEYDGKPTEAAISVEHFDAAAADMDNDIHQDTLEIIEDFDGKVFFSEYREGENLRDLAVFTCEALIHSPDPQEDFSAVSHFFSSREEAVHPPRAQWVEIVNSRRETPESLEELQQIVHQIESQIGEDTVELLIYQRHPVDPDPPEPLDFRIRSHDLVSTADLPTDSNLPGNPYFQRFFIDHELREHIRLHGGKDTIVAVIDRGFYVEHLKQISSGVVEDLSGTLGGKRGFVRGTRRLESNKARRNRHGTHSAQIIGADWEKAERSRALAPRCKLALIRLKYKKYVSTVDLASAIYLATGKFPNSPRGCDVVSLGLRLSQGESSPMLDQALEACCTEPRGRGGALPVVASNYSTELHRNDFPWLSQDSIMLIGRCDNHATRKLEGMQGVDLLTAHRIPQERFPVGTLKKTSACAPLVAGAAALLAGRFDLQVDKLHRALTQGAEPTPSPGRLSVRGAFEAAAELV